MILTGEEVKQYELKKLKTEIKDFTKQPKLVIVTVGENDSSKIYVNNKLKLASSLNILTHNECFTEESSEQEIIDYINDLNVDSSVNGIIVQLPLPKHFDEHKIVSTINYLKDVDGFSSFHTNNLYQGKNELLPCTVQGIIDLLNFYDIEIKQKNVVIVGRSLIVGKPLMHALTNLDATVSLCHSKTKDIKKYIENCDIFISAIGNAKYFTQDYFQNKDNLVVIDVGINRDENNKICGDVDFENVQPHVKHITPVPKGIGLLTVVNVVKNTIKNYKIMNEGDL